jgi:GntR family transcriptional repressor for pyruvate dehydrogenase complex
MALQRVVRRSVTDEVFEQIVDDVISGEYAAGQTLPSERELADVLGVSRPAVREAVQRLAQAGVVTVRQGDGTVVRDVRQFAGLDLLPRLLMPAGALQLDVARSIVESRQRVGPVVASLAAERTTPELAARLDAALAQLTSVEGDLDRQLAALAFWDVVVDGAESIVFRLMFNGLRAAYEPALAALSTLMAAEVSRHAPYAALTDAVRAGDASGAEAAAHDLLRPTTTAFLAAFAELEATP